MKLDFEKMGGIVPVIVQDNETLAVLMLGFMNEEALEKTQRDGRVTFWSRTKKRLWQKGETSGNFLEVVSIQKDCDEDTLLIKARPVGPTCHKGDYSCFGELDGGGGEGGIDFLTTLFRLIKSRKLELPEGAYTTSLFKEGLGKILAKVEEESGEMLVAAEKESSQRLVEEIADLIYHLMVLLVEKDVDLGEVVEELRRRRG